MTDMEPPSSSGEANEPPMTLGGRLMNVFVSPSEVFDDVKKNPHRAANWLAPITLCIIAGIIFTMVAFSQPRVLQSIRDAQEKAMQEMVDKGRMTRQQADQSLAMAEKFTSPSVLKTFGIISTMVVVAFKLFGCALLIWMIASFAFKTPIEYAKALEIAGLCAMISVLDIIIRMLLVMIYGNASMSLGPILFISNFNPQNKVHMLLAWLDVFLFWQIAIWSLGLARLTGQSFLKSFIWIFLCLAAIAGTCVGGFLSLSKLASSLGGK